MKLSHKKGGFTLIELMVVIAIIAILTAIITVNFTKARSSSRDAKRISDLAQIQLALELFFDRCNAYPQPNTLISPTALPLTTAPCPAVSGVTLGTFLSPIPTPPNSGETYDYGVNGSPATDYILRAKFESTNSALTDDVDTNPIYGLDCSDGAFNYCVQPKL